MKKLLERKMWEYKDGQLHTWGGRDNKMFGYISFDITFDPVFGDGKIKFISLCYPAFNKEVKINGGMAEIEQVLDKYYEWARELWVVLPNSELDRANEMAWNIINCAIKKHIKENGDFEI